MQIAEIADRAASCECTENIPHARLRLALRLDRLPVFVHGPEKRAVHGELVPVFARQHGVGLGPCGDEHRTRRQRHLFRTPSPPALLTSRLKRNAAAYPAASTSTARGVNPSAKRMPSSIALATSSWLRV